MPIARLSLTEQMELKLQAKINTTPDLTSPQFPPDDPSYDPKPVPVANPWDTMNADEPGR